MKEENQTGPKKKGTLGKRKKKKNFPLQPSSILLKTKRRDRKEPDDTCHVKGQGPERAPKGAKGTSIRRKRSEWKGEPVTSSVCENRSEP